MSSTPARVRRRLPAGARRVLRIAGLLAAAGASSAHGAVRERELPAPRISVSVADYASRGHTYDVTISGYARRRARAWVFIDYRRCTSFAVERDRASGEGQSYRVSRAFAMTSGWKSSRLGTDHACAYLLASGSGVVLATASAGYTIS